jgi:hypothetical protein
VLFLWGRTADWRDNKQVACFSDSAYYSSVNHYTASLPPAFSFSSSLFNLLSLSAFLLILFDYSAFLYPHISTHFYYAFLLISIYSVLSRLSPSSHLILLSTSFRRNSFTFLLHLISKKYEPLPAVSSSNFNFIEFPLYPIFN